MRRADSSRQDKGKERSDGVILPVRVQPRASRNGAELREDGTLKVRLTAPPVDNAANEALVRFLAEMLGVPRSSVEIISGQTGREKRVRISGMSDEALQQVLKGTGR